jgi:tRNA (uracil-5-)-methyltransferase TRM9
VHPDTFERLRALNHEFYQTFAKRFAEKRGRLQPGVMRAVQLVPPEARLLDLGCGHGLLAEQLLASGHQGAYLGLDLSEAMVTLAGRAIQHPQVCFHQADLSLSNWKDVLLQANESFQPPYRCVFCFASLHHVPGRDRRRELVGEVFDLMESGGYWTLSVWDFLQSERLRARLLPWEKVGIPANQVEDSDYLIDWRHGGQGIRYVHHFTPEALVELAARPGFDVVDSYRMDGENGRLGLYQVWQKP